MDRRRGDPKVHLDICFGRRTSVHFCVIVYESQILTLFVRELKVYRLLNFRVLGTQHSVLRFYNNS